MVLSLLDDNNTSVVIKLSDSSSDQLYDDKEGGMLNETIINGLLIYKIAIMLIKITFPLFVFLGTICNVLNLLLLSRGTLNKRNLNVYLSMLAVVDMIFIYTSAFKSWLRIVWGIELLHIGTWACKLGLFLNHLSVTLSAWILVVVSWQRWYTCFRPFARCCQNGNTRCGIAALTCLIIILVAANCYVLFTVELYQGSDGYKCLPRLEHDKIIGDIFPWLQLVLYSALPALVLLVLSLLLARVLYISRKSQQPSVNSRRQDVRTRHHQVTGLLICLSISWCMLTTPHTIFKFVERISNTEEEAATSFFLNVLFFIFLYTNHSINFFLYCALTKRFRQRVRRMLSRMTSILTNIVQICLCRHNRPRREAPVTRDDHQGHIDSFMPLIEQQFPQDFRQNKYLVLMGNKDMTAF